MFVKNELDGDEKFENNVLKNFVKMFNLLSIMKLIYCLFPEMK